MARKRQQEIDRAAVFEAILGDLGEEPIESGSAGLPLSSIRFNEQQPRKYFDPVSLDDLAHSIRQKGVLEPIIVRRAGEGYEVVAGERRTRAAKLAGLEEIPAIVVDIDDREALEIAITENLQREDLNAVEETEAVLGLLEVTLGVPRKSVISLLQALYAEERGRASSRKIDAAHREEALAVFRRVGRFGVASFVSNRLPILDFPNELLDVIRSGELEFTKAQAIARVADKDDRRQLLKEAVDQHLTLSQIRRRITDVRKGNNVMAAKADPAADETQRLVGATKRLLNRRRLATLDAERGRRVNELLRELQELLSE
ncbi:MAG: ParB/RepB/Spo0J family partition protein [Trueperaceae bacterium]